MPISFECPHCARSLKAKATLAGKRVRCPQCQHPVEVPAPASTLDEPEDDWLRDPEQPATGALTGAEAETESDGESRSSADEFPDLSEFLPSRKPTATDDEGLPLLPPVRSKRKSTANGEGGFVRPMGAGQEERPTRSRSAAAPEPVAVVEKTHHVWGAGPHWCVLFLFIPLALHIFWPGMSVEERMLENPEIAERWSELEGLSDLDEICAQLPGDRIPGAHLARQTSLHWVYGGVALFGYWGLLCFFLRNSSASPGRLFWTMVITGTIGIMLLLAFQMLAFSVVDLRIRGRGIIGLILLFVKFIGYSYVCALDPDSSLLGSMMGFTCGVGFCEELCKAMPIIFYLRNAAKSNWQGAFLMGLASGIGFGVSEGVDYSANYYNGITTGGIYLVRFLSCVALHAVWSSGVALLMYANQDYVDEFLSWEGFAMFVIHYLLVAMLLHGLYDTLLKKDYEIAALLTAFASFGWWLWVLGRVGKPIKRQRAATA
jgi:RsiW-degrading membrane proteinase PrsW (M82 family)